MHGSAEMEENHDTGTPRTYKSMVSRAVWERTVMKVNNHGRVSMVTRSEGLVTWRSHDARRRRRRTMVEEPWK